MSIFEDLFNGLFSPLQPAKPGTPAYEAFQISAQCRELSDRLQRLAEDRKAAGL